LLPASVAGPGAASARKYDRPARLSWRKTRAAYPISAGWQAKIMQRHGLQVTSPTLWDQQWAMTELLRPNYDAL
jgi:hypothetical protein